MTEGEEEEEEEEEEDKKKLLSIIDTEFGPNLCVPAICSGQKILWFENGLVGALRTYLSQFGVHSMLL